MAKLIKTEAYILDINDDFKSIEDFESYIDNRINYGDIRFFNVEQRDFEWNDDIDLNQYGCSEETYKKYFK